MGSTDGEMKWFQDKWDEWELNYPNDIDSELYYAEYHARKIVAKPSIPKTKLSDLTPTPIPKVKANLQKQLYSSSVKPEQVFSNAELFHTQRLKETLNLGKEIETVAFFSGRVPTLQDGRDTHILKIQLRISDYISFRTIAAKNNKTMRKQLEDWIKNEITT